MQSQNLVILIVSPLVLLDIWVQVVMPSLATLFADAARQELCYLAPVLRTVLLNALN